MQNFSLKNSVKAMFNMSSFGAVGGALLSAAMGGAGGVILFGGAALLGARNKYLALQRADGVEIQEPKTEIGQLLSRPTLTAETLVLAATYNFGDSVGQVVNDIINGDHKELLVDGLKAFAWGMGVCADNAVRQIDKVNFLNVGRFVERGKSKLVETFDAASINPTIFYNLSNLGFIAALVNQESLPLDQIMEELDHPDALMNGAAMFSVLALGLGMSCAVRSGRQLTKFLEGSISKADMNDDLMVGLGTLVPFTMCGAALSSGQDLMAAAQLAFGIVLLSTVPEARAALQKDASKDLSNDMK